MFELPKWLITFLVLLIMSMILFLGISFVPGGWFVASFLIAVIGTLASVFFTE